MACRRHPVRWRRRLRRRLPDHAQTPDPQHLTISRLDDLDHGVGIEQGEIQNLGARNLQRILDGKGAAGPARRNDPNVRAHLHSELGESLDLSGIEMRVVDDNGRRLQAAEVVRKLLSVVVNLEQRLPLQDQCPQQKRLAGPRSTHQKTVTCAFLKPARLALAPENPIAQDRSSRDRERAQRAWPPRHVEQASPFQSRNEPEAAARESRLTGDRISGSKQGSWRGLR